MSELLIGTTENRSVLIIDKSAIFINFLSTRKYQQGHTKLSLTKDSSKLKT
jgi:hypothetical protein